MSLTLMVEACVKAPALPWGYDFLFSYRPASSTNSVEPHISNSNVFCDVKLTIIFDTFTNDIRNVSWISYTFIFQWSYIVYSKIQETEVCYRTTEIKIYKFSRIEFHDKSKSLPLYVTHNLLQIGSIIMLYLADLYPDSR